MSVIESISTFLDFQRPSEPDSELDVAFAIRSDDA